jgi:hypothetical protein
VPVALLSDGDRLDRLQFTAMSRLLSRIQCRLFSAAIGRQMGSDPVASGSPSAFPARQMTLTFLTRSSRERGCPSSAISGPKQVQQVACRANYSITSSARASSDGGTVIPSAFAVLRLMTNSILVGCKTGRSAGLAPFKIFAT